MSSATTIYQTPEWQAIANTVIAACLVLFLMITLVILFLRRRNIPVSQTIEVDSREPHSITITFVPAQVIGKNPDCISANNATNPTTATVNIVTPNPEQEAGARAGGGGTGPSIDPQSAPVA